MNIVLIGGSGQDAFYLAKYLSDSGNTVYWLHRNSIIMYEKYIINRAIKCFRVKNYSYPEIESCLSDLSYSCVVLIAGAVGNSLARNSPIELYDINAQILFAVCSLIVNSKHEPHLYYFSSCDIDGRTSTSPFVFSSSGLTAPSTTYGLSKRHSAEFLKTLVDSGDISSTIVHLGMHESFCRKGNYVLSKVKKMIRAKLTNVDISPVSFGNLNVWLDIGFAPDFMEALGDLILAQFRPLELTIGTGRYSHLKLLCQSILEEYQISFDQYVAFDDSFDRPTFYPLMPSSFIGQHSLLKSSTRMLNNGPSPLTPQMLKSEDHAFKVN